MFFFFNFENSFKTAVLENTSKRMASCFLLMLKQETKFGQIFNDMVLRIVSTTFALIQDHIQYLLLVVSLNFMNFDISLTRRLQSISLT